MWLSIRLHRSCLDRGPETTERERERDSSSASRERERETRRRRALQGDERVRSCVKFQQRQERGGGFGDTGSMPDALASSRCFERRGPLSRWCSLDGGPHAHVRLSDGKLGSSLRFRRDAAYVTLRLDDPGGGREAPDGLVEERAAALDLRSPTRAFLRFARFFFFGKSAGRRKTLSRPDLARSIRS